MNEGHRKVLFKESVSKCYHNTNYSNKLKLGYHITKYIRTFHTTGGTL